ncbi:hypothetical protein LR48_Vigan10g066400 [Vigna angularis]|uniref:Uncharacterized protein n=1 Tax=Phaseolus angularis TaxID=3914 RepID=A0A0L9VIN4_PHAAN|nr:hypothetical protein LR48_Vigan10g066400 [Vigna angularis]
MAHFSLLLSRGGGWKKHITRQLQPATQRESPFRKAHITHGFDSAFSLLGKTHDEHLIVSARLHPKWWQGAALRRLAKGCSSRLIQGETKSSSRHP